MTELQRDLEESRLQLESLEALAMLMIRLRSDVPRHVTYQPCGFCAKLIRQDAYCCDRCGWKVAV